MSALSLRLAIDVGNTRTKFGVYASSSRVGTYDVPTGGVAMGDGGALGEVATWFRSNSTATIERVGIASVHRAVSPLICDWAKREWPAADIRLLQHSDFRLPIDVVHPERVGIDRLAGAAAANALRDPTRAAVIVDLGTAGKVNLVTVDGVFAGGAIMPGIEMAARALNQQTDQLPAVELPTGVVPEPLGKHTEAAMQAGIFWGTVGAVRELIARIGPPDAEVFLTGGRSTPIAPFFPAARHEPHLVLDGVALTACDK